MAKRTISLFVILCIALMAFAQNRTVNIECGGLEQALAGNYSFKSITINGSMDVRDFACINDNAMTITAIDLSGCTIQSYDSRDEQYLGIHTHFEAGTIPPTAFGGFAHLESVILPANVKAIGEGAFAGCVNLTSVTGCSSLEKIDNYAFSGCALLDEMELPATLREIGDYAFDKCSSMSHIDLSTCLQLTSIGKRAFAQNTTLATVKFPNTLNAICDAAFAGCEQLREVLLPQSLSVMGAGVFAACTDLQKVDMSQCGIEKISPWTFSACSLLSQVLLPESVVAIEEGAFSYCESLRSIALPLGVAELDAFAFAGCSALEALNFMPEGLEEIGRYAFYHNTAAEQTIIPTTVSYIDDHAFDGCVNSVDVYSMRELPAELGEMVFANMQVENKTLYVLASSIPIYEGMEQWKDFGLIDRATEIEDVEVAENFKVYFEQYNLTIESSQAMSEVRLYDTAGMMLSHVQPDDSRAVVDTRSFAGNIYLLSITTADGQHTVFKVARVIR